MSSESTDQPINETTARNATRVDALDMRSTQLIGLFSGGDVPRAMLRLANGGIVMAAAGDETPWGEITAIADSYVLVRQGRTIRRLML